MMTERITRRLLALLLPPMFLAAGCIGATTPLGKAVSRDDLKDVQDLLAQGADPCEKAGRGSYTSLDLAIGDMREVLKSDQIKLPVYEALLEQAFQRALSGRKCERVLFYAARIGAAEKIRQLLARGEDPNQDKEDWETSPLGIAAYYEHEDTVIALIEGGADIDQQIFNFEKYRLWAVSIGKQTGYIRADRAIKLLRMHETGKQSRPRQ